MMLALGAGALGAAMLHLVAHGLAKALLFLGAGSVNHATHKTGIWELGGVVKKMPITGVTFIIGAASLAGIPPLVGFWSKDEVLVAVSDGRGAIFLALALAGALLSALYMARVAFVVFFGRPRGYDEAHESPGLITVPLALLAAGSVAACVLVFDWAGSYDGFGAFLLADQEFLHHVEKFQRALAGGSLLAPGNRRWRWDGLSTFEGAYRTRRWRRDLGPVYRARSRNTTSMTCISGLWIESSWHSGGAVAAFDRVVVNDGGVDGLRS